MGLFDKTVQQNIAEIYGISVDEAQARIDAGEQFRINLGGGGGIVGSIGRSVSSVGRAVGQPIVEKVVQPIAEKLVLGGSVEDLRAQRRAAIAAGEKPPKIDLVGGFIRLAGFTKGVSAIIGRTNPPSAPSDPKSKFDLAALGFGRDTVKGASTTLIERYNEIRTRIETIKESKFVRELQRGGKQKGPTRALAKGGGIAAASSSSCAASGGGDPWSFIGLFAICLIFIGGIYIFKRWWYGNN